MEIIIKVRYGASKQHVEYFGNNRYIFYLEEEEDAPESTEKLKNMISKNLGVPPNRIFYKRIDPTFGDVVIEI